MKAFLTHLREHDDHCPTDLLDDYVSFITFFFQLLSWTTVFTAQLQRYNKSNLAVLVGALNALGGKYSWMLLYTYIMIFLGEKNAFH